MIVRTYFSPEETLDWWDIMPTEGCVVEQLLVVLAGCKKVDGSNPSQRFVCMFLLCTWASSQSPKTCMLSLLVSNLV